MGNNHSQASEEEDGPSYNYHEEVLRDAQSTSASRNSVSNEGEDEYYSAEEGDSIHSVTPPRTRPESSSGEDYSDSESISNIRDVSPQVERNIVQTRSENQDGNLNGRRELTPVRNSDTYNVSTFQEHDSITAELEAAVRRSSTSFLSSANSTGQNLDLSSSNRTAAASQHSVEQIRQTASNVSLSPFVPITPIKSSSLNKYQLRGRENSPISGKRKVDRGSESPRGDYVWPRKRMATRATSKRKRLGYYDSSESESENDRESRRPVKRGKVKAASPKENRSNCHSRGRGANISDSDEQRYGRKSHLRHSGHGGSSDSDSGEIRRDRRRCARKTENLRVKSKRKKSDYSSDDSEVMSAVRKRSWHRSGRHSESDEGQNVGKALLKESGKLENRKNAGSEGQKVNEQNPQKVVQEPVLQETVEQIPNCSPKAAYSQSFKMGLQGLRKAQSKMVPLSQQDQGSTDSSMGPTEQRNILLSKMPKFDSSHVSNILENLRPINSAFMSLKIPVLKRKAATPLELDDKDDNLNISPTQIPRQLCDGIPEFQQKLHSIPASQDVNISSFENVTITPPKQNVLESNLPEPSPENLQLMGNGCDAREENLDMEFEESDVSMDSQPSPTIFKAQEFKPRVYLRGRRRGRTAVDRFRNFWSKQRTTIGSNLKSLFSKVKSPSSNAIDQTRKFPVATHSNSLPGSHTARNSSHPFSPVTYLNSNTFMEPVLTSSPPNHSFASQQLQPPLTSSYFSAPSQLCPVGQGMNSAVQTLNLQTREQQNGYFTNTCLLTSGSQASPGTSSSCSPSQPNPGTMGGCSRQKYSLSLRTGTGSVEHLPQESKFQVLNCRLGSILDLSISLGDIADQTTAGIVNWTDGALSHQVTECSKSVSTKAGALMRAGCHDYIESKGGLLEVPDVLTTPAGGKFDKAVKVILHVVAPIWIDGSEERNIHSLIEVYVNCFRFAGEKHGLSSVSFPLIGSDIFPLDMCVQTFFDALLVFMAEQSALNQGLNLSTIRLIISDPASTDFAADLVQSRLEEIKSNGLDSAITATYKSYCYNTWGNSSPREIDVKNSVSDTLRIKRPRL